MAAELSFQLFCEDGVFKLSYAFSDNCQPSGVLIPISTTCNPLMIVYNLEVFSACGCEAVVEIDITYCSSSLSSTGVSSSSVGCECPSTICFSTIGITDSDCECGALNRNWTFTELSNCVYGSENVDYCNGLHSASWTLVLIDGVWIMQLVRDDGIVLANYSGNQDNCLFPVDMHNDDCCDCPDSLCFATSGIVSGDCDCAALNRSWTLSLVDECMYESERITYCNNLTAYWTLQLSVGLWTMQLLSNNSTVLVSYTLTQDACQFPLNLHNTTCIASSSSGGNSGVIPVTCCPTVLLPLTVIITVTGGGAVNGSYNFNYQSGQWWGTIGSCSGLGNMFTLCGFGSVWTFQVISTAYVYDLALSTCVPFHIVWTGVNFGPCGGSSGATVTLTF